MLGAAYMETAETTAAVATAVAAGRPGGCNSNNVSSSSSSSNNNNGGSGGGGGGGSEVALGRAANRGRKSSSSKQGPKELPAPACSSSPSRSSLAAFQQLTGNLEPTRIAHYPGFRELQLDPETFTAAERVSLELPILHTQPVRTQFCG